MIAIGVDPGKTAAIVALNHNGGVFFCIDNKEWNAKTCRHYLIFADNQVFAAVERQQYMAKGGRAQGAKSAFSLGAAFSYWLGFFDAAGVRVVTPWPREWQRFYFGSGTVISDPK